MAVDPTNPNIVYLGGTQDYQTSGLIRVDLTGPLRRPRLRALRQRPQRRRQAHPRQHRPGRRQHPRRRRPVLPGRPTPRASAPGSTTTSTSATRPTQPVRHQLDPVRLQLEQLHQRRDRGEVDSRSTRSTTRRSTARPTSTSSLTIVDPLTGLTRLIIADDQGVFTGVFNADGTLNTVGHRHGRRRSPAASTATSRTSSSTTAPRSPRRWPPRPPGPCSTARGSG